MRALVLEGSGSIAARNVPAPDNPGECRIRVRLAGICGTDLQMLEGYAAFRGIPGHEFVGVVDAVSSPDDERWLNKRVVSEINVGCGRCSAAGPRLPSSMPSATCSSMPARSRSRSGTPQAGLPRSGACRDDLSHQLHRCIAASIDVADDIPLLHRPTT